MTTSCPQFIETPFESSHARGLADTTKNIYSPGLLPESDQPRSVELTGNLNFGGMAQNEGPAIGREAEPPFHGRLPLQESLGRTGLAVILGGSLLILSNIAFLSLLWFGYGDEPEAAGAPWIWRQIALHDWMTRTVTISSLVLRSIVSLQGATCTSMTAALVLEKRAARKSDVAYLSMARSVSDGPRKVIQLFLSSRSWSVVTYAEFWLICLLGLTMLALQFSSTFLLSDFHDFVIVSGIEARPIGIFAVTDMQQGLSSSGYEVYDGSPIFSTFGEERSDCNVTPDALGFSDTGIQRRGYLPIEGGENRTSIRSYRGPTFVVNSRVICVPPQIRGRLLTKDPVYQGNHIGHIVGTINYGRSLRQAREGIGPLCPDNGCESVAFDSGEWASLEITEGRFVDVSLCFARLFVQPSYVNMIAHKPTYEPVLAWDGFHREHNSTSISASVGLDDPLKAPSERGLMDMEIFSKDFKKAPGGPSAVELGAAIFQTFVRDVTTAGLAPGSISACAFCSDYSVVTAPKVGIFLTDITRSTGRAAITLHSYIAISASTLFNNIIKAFNVTDIAEISATTSVRTPGPCPVHRCSGFTAVTTLLGIYLAIITALTTIYVQQVRYSRCSNAWHAISQLAGEELEGVLHEGNNATDKSITKILNRDGKNGLVKLGLGNGSRVHVLPYDKKN
ncbi:hypothetical protein O1611_g8449 [Lasiodiplodia mahajangana]|uniref:Uncharacterized protein n=1 Tax=Lasiodiplodia mahajangana TaxID=1108764 RepID=A0ACC2JCT3_9PEZI|nr:hypothetical protein O1611_g8449 [Lasiodiplodia mahajangana]